MAATQRPYAGAAFAATPSSPPAWNTLPCWYLLGTQDKAIPPELSGNGRARRGDDRGGAGLARLVRIAARGRAQISCRLSRPPAQPARDPRLSRRSKRSAVQRRPWSVRRAITAITAAVLLVAGLSASGARATASGTNGRLTFMRQDYNQFWQVWTSNPDLTAEHQLTSGHVNSGWSVWSPDASRIAFDSDRSDPDPSDNTFINDVF